MFVGARDRDSTCPIFLSRKRKKFCRRPRLCFPRLCGVVQSWEVRSAIAEREKCLCRACCRYPKLLRQAGRLPNRADLTTGVKGSVPSDFFYTAGADAWVTRWLTGDFDLAGQRIFGTQTVSVTQQQFLANCGSCTSSPNPGTVTLPSLATSTNSPLRVHGHKTTPIWQGVRWYLLATFL